MSVSSVRICPSRQNVIRHARIGSGDAVENVIEWNLSAFVIAMLARLDQPLRLAESCGLDEYDNLLFWCWVRRSRRTLESDFSILRSPRCGRFSEIPLFPA